MAGLVSWGVILQKKNKKLSEELEMAQNNVTAYQGFLSDSWQANNVLRLNIEDLSIQNDKLLHDLDSVRAKLKIKPKDVQVAATQSQIIYVSAGQGVGGEVLPKDTVYKDSILINPLTKIVYELSKDSINIDLDIKNTQYLYIYKKKEYINKKCFFKRLYTFDFKKITRYKYNIVNTNDILKTTDVRIIEANTQ